MPQYSLLFDKLKKRFGTRLKTIGEIATVICGPFGSAIKNTDYQEFGIPLIRITNISKEGYMDYENLIYISEALGSSLARTQVSEGDIVISQRGSLGQCAVVDNTFEKLNISANIIAVKNIREVSSDFLHDYLLSDIGQTLLERNVSGQVQQKITTQDITDLPVPINCNEKRLTQIMGNAYASCMHKFDQVSILFDGMNDYILSKLKMDKFAYKQYLCCGIRLSNLIKDRTFNAEYYHPERIRVINSLVENEFISTLKLSEVVYFCRDIVSCCDRSQKYLGLAGVESQTGELSGVDEEASGQAFKYEVDDVLYGRLRPYLNKVLLAEETGICSTEFYVMRVKDKSIILPEYLAAIMRSDLILSQTKHMMTGNTHPRISSDDVKNLYVPIPDIFIQYAIVKELQQRRDTARQLRKEAEQEWVAAKKQFERELLQE